MLKYLSQKKWIVTFELFVLAKNVKECDAAIAHKRRSIFVTPDFMSIEHFFYMTARFFRGYTQYFL